ncbi:hypothetical protein [Kitasatospora sp. NPDC057223]|uniref:hypothetical protein n=1 Tax=Kitasatospora sp. NPDC057223 TaxID=3346055 RepID=UPI003634E811
MTTTTRVTVQARPIDPVQPGDVVVLIGASGSGKSTALRDVPPHQIVSLDRLRAVVSEPVLLGVHECGGTVHCIG